MKFFQRRSALGAQPKIEREHDPVQDDIDTINRLQREILQQLRIKGDAALKSRLLLEDEQCKVLRRLRHEHCVLPTINQKTGYWYIYRS